VVEETEEEGLELVATLLVVVVVVELNAPDR
jgi:hypothetical protein